MTRSPRARGLEVRGAGRGLRGPPGCGGAQGRRGTGGRGVRGTQGRGGREGMGRRRQVYVCDRAGPPALRPPWRPRQGSASLGRVASPGGRSATGPSPSTGQARPACTPPSFSLHASGFPWGTVGTPAPQPRSRTARPARPTVCFQPPEFQPKLKLFHLYILSGSIFFSARWLC